MTLSFFKCPCLNYMSNFGYSLGSERTHITGFMHATKVGIVEKTTELSPQAYFCIYTL